MMNSRVEDLVAAVLGIGLREHHQLDIGGIAPERAESLDQIVDLLGRQREPQLGLARASAARPSRAESHHCAAARGAAA